MVQKTAKIPPFFHFKKDKKYVNGLYTTKKVDRSLIKGKNNTYYSLPFFLIKRMIRIEKMLTPIRVMKNLKGTPIKDMVEES